MSTAKQTPSLRRFRNLVRTSSERATPGALFVLRVLVGVILVVHGAGKVADYGGWVSTLGEMGFGSPELLAPFAVAGELGGGIGLILGLATPLAATGAMTTMLVAIFGVHWGNGLLAANGGYELPLLLAMVCAVFLVRGGGRLSIDHLLMSAWTSGSADEKAELREAHA